MQDITKALVFAAGLGTRLSPLTDTLPKALIPLGSKPILEHILLKIKHIGISDVVVNVHHFADNIIEFLDSKHNFGLNIMISDERDCLLETGGGLVHARPLLHPASEILIHNADVYSNIDLSKLIEYQRNNNVLATLAVQNRKSKRMFSVNNSGYVSGWKNFDTNEEIGEQSSVYKSFTGIHVVSSKIFDMLPSSGVFSITPEYLKICKSFDISTFDADYSFWFDIGTPEKLEEARIFYSKNEAM